MRSIAISGSDRRTDLRVLLSVTSEKSRRRLKMIVSGTTTCFHPVAIVSTANCQSW